MCYSSSKLRFLHTERLTDRRTVIVVKKRPSRISFAISNALSRNDSTAVDLSHATTRIETVYDIMSVSKVFLVRFSNWGLDNVLCWNCYVHGWIVKVDLFRSYVELHVAARQDRGFFLVFAQIMTFFVIKMRRMNTPGMVCSWRLACFLFALRRADITFLVRRLVRNLFHDLLTL